jgi:hypothetical protein
VLRVSTLHQEAEIEPGRSSADTDYAHDPSLWRTKPFCNILEIVLSLKILSVNLFRRAR